MTQVREPITAPRGLGWVELVFCVLAIHSILAGSSLYSQEESVPPGVPPPPRGACCWARQPAHLISGTF